MAGPPVAIIMGSQSDWATMRHAAETLDALGVGMRRGSSPPIARPTGSSPSPRAPRRQGFKVIIAGAGGAAHLPGMTAALTTLPVFGVPVESKALSGQDSLFRSCRCRPACRSARSPSAGRARSMRRCSPPPSWRSPIAALAERLDAWRGAPDRGGGGTARGRADA